ncbi:MAG: LexA family transcriptional regulator [Tenuifilaceae bacterium]|nr:LexA family transcriptional regulator [Tenuifilaceae bacterium]
MFVHSNLKFLRGKMGLTQAELAEQVNLNRSTVNNYENRLADPPLDIVVRFADYFGVALDSMLRIDLSSLSSGRLKSVMDGTDAFVKGRNLRVVATTVGDDNIDNIELVEAKAQAGYLSGFADPEYIEQLPIFRLPFLNPGRKYRTFQIVGDSMLPIPPGSWITAEYLDDWTTIKNGTAAVVLTIDDGLTFKIVENLIEQMGMLRLSSLNPIYKPYAVRVTNVREIWQFSLFISPFLPSGNIEHDQLLFALRDLQTEVKELKRRLPQ